jgi:hypothetical protein
MFPPSEARTSSLAIARKFLRHLRKPALTALKWRRKLAHGATTEPLEEGIMAVENETPSTAGAPAENDRRNFLRAAVSMGVAGAAVLAGGEALAEQRPAAATRATRTPSTPGATRLSAAELAKDAKRAEAERILRDLGDNVEVQWVKGNVPGVRRIIQLKG